MSIVKDIVKIHRLSSDNDINIKPSHNTICIHDGLIGEYNILNKFKNQISDFELNKWDYFKKLTNKFELVYISNDANNSISLYKNNRYML